MVFFALQSVWVDANAAFNWRILEQHFQVACNIFRQSEFSWAVQILILRVFVLGFPINGYSNICHWLNSRIAVINPR